MTEYVRPMDLHAHNGGCELYGCIAVVKADEHAAALSRLDEALKKLHELELIEKAHHEAIDETDFFADKLKEVEAERNELQRRLGRINDVIQRDVPGGMSQMAFELDCLRRIIDIVDQGVGAGPGMGSRLHSSQEGRNHRLEATPTSPSAVENPVTIATDRTNERQTCNHCGNPVPCACW